MSDESPYFLDSEDVLELHALQLARYDGADGMRDRGLLSALVFLDLNGISISHSAPGLYDLTLGVAKGRVTKAEAAETLRRIAQNR